MMQVYDETQQPIEQFSLSLGEEILSADELNAKAARARKLWAAAPDMLAALKMFMEIDAEPSLHGSMPVFLRGFREEAMKAIRKAERGS